MEFRINERTGNPCCFVHDASGRPTRPDDAHACDRCRAHFRLQEDTMNNNENDDYDMFDGTPPDPYEQPLAQLRAASSAPSTPEANFAARHAAERTAEFEQTEMDLNVDEYIEATPLPRLTDAELEEFAPPTRGAKRSKRCKGGVAR